MTIPVKPLNEIEVKSEVSVDDKILILDSDTDEARLASKEELKWDKGDKGDTWETWPQGIQWPKWDKWDKGDKWDTWAKWDKWDKGDTWNTWPTWPQGEKWDAFTYDDFTPEQLEALTWPKGDKWDKGDKGDKWDKGNTWASVINAAFVWDDLEFGKDDSTTIILEWAKTTLTWPQWPKGDTGNTWPKGDTWASIVQAWFSGDDMVFTKDDSTSVTIENAKPALKWDTGATGAKWDTWNWISSVTATKSWKTTTVTMNYTSWNPTVFQVQDGADGEWSWDMNTSTYDPTGKMADAFDYGNMYNTPSIPWKTSDLNNDSWFITNAVNDLTNYYTKTQTYTKSEIDSIIANFWWFEVVATLPTQDIKTNVIYLKWPIGTWADRYEEWIYYSNTWTKIWETSVDLSPYYTAAQVDTLLGNKQNTLTAWENIKIANNTISANNVFIITEADVTVSTDDTKWVAPYNTSYGYTNIDISANAGIEWREWAIYTFVVDTEMVVASANRNVRVKIWNWTYIPVMWSSSILSWSSYFTKSNTRQYQYSTKYESWWALHLFTDSNTTYSAMSASEATTWTATTARSISASVLKWAVQTHSPVQSVNWKTWAVSLSIPTSSDDLTEWSTNLFLTSAERTKLGNTSWTNSWDETASSIKTKLWITTISWSNTWDETTATIKTKLWAATSNADWYLKKEDFATFNWKQAALVSWTNIKTINNTSVLWTWNIAVQATLVSWTNIKTVNSTSLLGSGDIAVQPTLVSWTNIKTVNSNSILGSGNISLNEFNPWWTATTWYVVTKTADGYEWQAPSWWLSVAPNSPITWIKYIWYGTESDYAGLSQYYTDTPWDTEYHCF